MCLMKRTRNLSRCDPALNDQLGGFGSANPTANADDTMIMAFIMAGALLRVPIVSQRAHEPLNAAV